MRTFELTGQATSFISSCLSKIGFKNVKNISTSSNRFIMDMKDGTKSEILFLESGQGAVVWGVDDFAHQASQNPDVEYDETKFREALSKMIDKHDANIGITWDTIDFWLNEICLKV